MRFLFPLFLAGAAAVAVPIVLHLARRRTRAEQPFSSLMFLTPSPPRFQARRRIERWLLLAVRCLAIVLLAGAFARPFVSRPLPLLGGGQGRRAVLLVDRSASMRRADLWAQAQARARAQLERAQAGDRLAVLLFDRTLQPLLGFDEWSRLAPGERAAAVTARLEAATPGWAATDLGRALVGAADLLLEDEAAAAAGAPPSVAREVILVSDLQSGAELGALAASDWPRDVRLVLDTVAAPHATNVGLAVVPGGQEESDSESESQAAPPVRVRVSAAEDAGPARVSLRWVDRAGAATEVDLAPGQSRTLLAPARAEVKEGSAGGTLALSGDDVPFDNQVVVAPPLAAEARIVYVGRDDGRDPAGPLFFLERAFPRTRLRAPTLVAHLPGDARLAADLAGAHLVVVTAAPDAAAEAPLRAHLGRGRTVLWALDGVAAAAALARLAGVAGLPAREDSQGRDGVQDSVHYGILTQLDFSHPVLAPFAEARFSDFTKIRFWKRRILDPRGLPGAARTLARFDDGAPALLSLPVGRGQILVLASGWQPAESQLALSSKFVPLLHAVLEASAGLASGQTQFTVGDPVPLPPADGGSGRGRAVRKPDGARVALAPDATAFTDTDLPGLYTLDGPAGSHPFAVNLAAAESATAPMPLEHLERLGIPVGAAGAPPPPVAAARPQDQSASWNAGLESQQRPWRWIVLGLFVLLVAETLLARSRAATPLPGAAP